MPKPGNTTQRGYGADHQGLRAVWAPIVATGTVPCRRCTGLIRRDDAWQLGHDDHDRRIPAAPEHKLCNLRAAAAKTNGTLDPPLRTSEDW